MGTVGYMSPEQAAGQRVDFRSDQFSFGSILYEMVTGKRAFERATRPEILAAIIRDGAGADCGTSIPRPPPSCAGSSSGASPRSRTTAMRRRRTSRETSRPCASTPRTSRARPDVPLEAPRRRARWGAIGLAAALLAALAGIYLLGRRVERSRTSPPRFRQLTFRGAGISTARFAPDGQTVVYAAQWEGKPPELFTARLDSPETRSLGLSRAEILSISSSGQMALLLAPRFGLLFRAPHSDLSVDPSRLRGVLAEAPLAGGAPRELLEETYFADWSPDGKSLAVVRYVGGKNRLEFPVGRVLYETERGPVSPDLDLAVGRSGCVRVSRQSLRDRARRPRSAISVSEPWRLRGAARRMRSGSTPSRAGPPSFSPSSRVARRGA